LPEPSTQVIFRGFFSVKNNLVTSFYDYMKPNVNIYTNNGADNEDSIFITSPFYKFSDGGTNITSIPYLKKTQNDTSSWFNLAYVENTVYYNINYTGFAIQSENQVKSSLDNGIYSIYFVNMTFKPIFNFNKIPMVLTVPMDYSNPSYPSGKNHRSTFYKSLFDTTLLPYGKQYDNCTNTLCYTYSKNYIYKPHSDYGMVGRTSAGYLGQRNRL
jgi:hypothetical protein